MPKKLDKFETNKWYNRDRPPMQYVDPNIGLYNPDMLQEGQTYVAPSLAPKEVLADPNAVMPYDRYPVDWSLTSEAGTDESVEERNQRNIVRQFLEQKYGQAAKLGGVEQAMKRGERENLMADVGYGLDRMFMAQSAARGGPGADAGYWQGKKREAAGRVEEAEGLRQAKIKDYLMTKNLGQQGVEELQKMRKFDIENASNDPNSQISRSYQNAFGAMYPEETQQMLGDLQKMSANEIKDIAGMYGKKAQMDLQRLVELGRLGYMETMANAPSPVDQSKADLNAAQTDYWTQRANQLRQTAEAPIAGRNQIQKTPKAQLEEDLLKAKLATEQARAKALGGKGITTPTGQKIELTEGDKAVDRDYAKDYNEWMVQGKSNYDKNYKILTNTIAKMEQAKKEGRGEQISGTSVEFKQNIPFGKYTRSTESKEIEDAVKDAAIGSLRAAFGGNPTEGEREALKQTYFNRELPLQTNINKLRGLKEYLDSIAARNNEQAKYWQKHGTLKGFGDAMSNTVRILDPSTGQTARVPNDPATIKKYTDKGGKVVP